MRLPQFSILKLMIIVGIVALNLASTQLWSHSSDPSLLTGRSLIFIALQVGLFRLIRNCRTRFLPFWAGFVAFGLAAAITSIYIDFFSTNDSELADLMDLYLFNSYGFIESILIMVKGSLHNGSYTDNFVFELVSFLPQLSIALIGGLLTSLTVRCRGNRRDPVTLVTSAD